MTATIAAIFLLHKCNETTTSVVIVKRKTDKEKVLSIRLPASFVADIDNEIVSLKKERGGEKVTRANAIRLLLRAGLKARKDARP